MTLTVDGMMRDATQGQKASVAASIRADQAGASDTGASSIGQQLNATSVHLSVYGLIKSSFAQVESAGINLSMSAKAGTTEDATKAVQSFAAAYNNAARTAASAALGGGDAGVNLAAVDLGKVVTSGNNAADLKRVGINVAHDGTLSVDTQALQGALQVSPDAVYEMLTKIGAQAARVSGSVLAGSLNNAAGARATGMAPATVRQRPAGITEDAARQQAATLSGNASGGIAAYLQAISL